MASVIRTVMPEFGADGPGIVGAINARNPSLKVIVLGATEGLLEPAYRIRRIF